MIMEWSEDMLDEQIVNSKKRFLNQKKIEIKKSNSISNIRLVLFLIGFILVIFYFKKGNFIFLGGAILFFVAFVICIIIHRMVDERREKLDFYLGILARYENRTSDEWKKEDQKIVTDMESFLYDLDIFGQDSLLQFLDFTYSLGGQNRLIDELSLKKVEKRKIVENREAIAELHDKFSFVIEFQEVLGKIESIEKTDFKTIFKLFNYSGKCNGLGLAISLVLSAITTVSCVLAFLHFFPYYIFIGFALLQLGISYFYMNANAHEFEDLAKYARLANQLKHPFEYVLNQEFSSKKNKRLRDDIDNGYSIIKKSVSLGELDMFRSNFITYSIANIFFSLNFLLLYRYRTLLTCDMDDLKKAVDSLEEIECLISLLTVGLVKKVAIFPEIIDDMSLDIRDIKHPLLKEKTCVSNDFECGRDINIITGSNMGGKTSFMKTIGMNLVLGYLGTYVCASKFDAPIMKIFTSINVKDDIQNGISTFYGELKRIKNVIDYSFYNNNRSIIVFIDEIFKGTNYNDRIYGAKEVLKKLSKMNSIVFLTTHDFELCELKNKKCINYHFEEHYEDEKIRFDYKIKDGRCKTTNAKYLMRQMGIIDSKK